MKVGRFAFPLLLVLTLGTLGCGKGDTGPMGPQGPPGPSVVLGFASLDATTPAVYNFGGGRTTGVTISSGGTGLFLVTFTGTYTGVTGVGDISVLITTSDAYDYYQNAHAIMNDPAASADATTIEVPVHVEYDGSDADIDFSVVVLSSK
jgi:hypothetical protein